MDPKSGFLVGLFAMARQDGVWKNVGAALIGILLGADLAVLGYVARKLETLDERVTQIQMRQAEAIGEAKGSHKSYEDRIRRLEERQK